MTRRIHDIGEAAGILRSGGVLVLGTDTLPGLHCLVPRDKAVERIFTLKGRASDRPLLVLAGSPAQARSICGPLDRRQEKTLEKVWPGPFSVILPAGPDVPGIVTAGGATVAIRVPRLAPLRELILAAGTPLVSTSANLSGHSPTPDPAEAAAVFGDGIDGWWAAPGRPPAGGRASAVVDLTVRPPRVVREGPEPWDDAWSADLDEDSPEE